MTFASDATRSTDTRRTIDVTHGSYRFKDVHTSRTQRDAGIEFDKWTGRIKPLRSWSRMAAEALFLGTILLLCLAVYVVMP